MKKLLAGVQRFWREEEGTETVEWALLAGLVVAVGAAIFSTIGDESARLLGGRATELENAGGGAAP